jgi:hypothetical protein
MLSTSLFQSENEEVSDEGPALPICHISYFDNKSLIYKRFSYLTIFTNHKLKSIKSSSPKEAPFCNLMAFSGSSSEKSPGQYYDAALSLSNRPTLFSALATSSEQK